MTLRASIPSTAHRLRSYDFLNRRKVKSGITATIATAKLSAPVFLPRARGRSEHGAFSCEEHCIPAPMHGWGYPWEEDGGTKCQRWMVTRDSAWHCAHD